MNILRRPGPFYEGQARPAGEERGGVAYGLYLHIPFCRAKCRYCDFYSRGGCKEVPEAYVDALIAALGRWREEAAGGAGALRPGTVYFGGGTPGLLRPEQVKRLLAAADPLPGAEVTLEANPDGLTAGLLAGWRRAGVNRLSLGVQTARDESLARLGRRHTAADSRTALQMARDAGFENISGDIMLALPGYSEAEFCETLALLAEGGATHISAYLLKLEPGTAFGARPPAGLPDEDAAAEFYLGAVRRLEAAGYRQYEISNFARPGFEGRHNLIYWNCGDYLGLGPAAHSCMGGRRFYWPADTAAFAAGSAVPVPDGGCDAEDFIMLQLRLSAGFRLAQLKELYGAEFTEKQLRFVKRCCEAGYAVLEGGVLRLTPRGMLLQNSILCELLE